MKNPAVKKTVAARLCAGRAAGRIVAAPGSAALQYALSGGN